jgi:hemoglobin
MEQSDSLFLRIGGKDALNAVVDIFYAKVLESEKIKHFFADLEMNAQRAKMKNFLLFAFGAPKTIAFYEGKKMREAHAHLHLKEEHFYEVAQLLLATLQELQVPQPLIDEVLSIALSTKNDVLNN